MGDYRLIWARTMNSRGFGGSGDLGAGGGWTHSYRWIASSDIFTSPNPGTPTRYTVALPNGGAESFTCASGACSPDFLGIRDRFLPLNLTTLLAYLVLPDGGMVEFKATVQKQADSDDSTNPPTITWTSWYSYQAQAIIDPSGLRTSLTYDTLGRLSKVTEPAGRWLKLYYDTSGSFPNQITRVDAGFNTSTVTQSVSYVYAARTFVGNSYNVLLNANYSDGTAAIYTYQAANTAGNPLISTCTDVRYPGPMKNIAYEFKAGGFYGQLYREKHPNGTAVATLTTSGNTRTETRGDGKTRKWTYNAALPSGTRLLYLLASQTDFFPTTTHPATTFVYGAWGNLTSVTDPNGHKTSFTRIGSTGAILTMTRPLVASEGTATVTYEYEDPATGYYLKKKTDELGHITTYTHDSSMRTTAIDYPIGSESFVYNQFDQVLDHTMLSGGVEHYAYDSRGRMTQYTPPATPLDGDPNPSLHPTIFGYDGEDHLQTVKDPRGNTVTYAYNDRGQVTKVTNPDIDRSEVNNTYNSDGTLKSVSVDYSATAAAVTNYTYDDYKRLRTVQTPLRFTGDPTARITNYYYDNNGTGVDDYSHTDSNVTRMVSPGGVVTKNVYDNNHWLLNTTVGYGSGEGATTGFTYDNVGNLLTKTEPRYYYGSTPPQWVYVYDARDRVKSVNDPLGNQTSFTYDKASNKKTEARPNGQVITYNTYDAMDRLTKMTVPQTASPVLNAVTQYTWTDAGKLETMTDPNLKVYSYAYDYLNRLRLVTYPSGGGTESYTYDFAGNKASFKNRAGKTQTFTYDNRNRETKNEWDDGITATRTLTYDDASNVLTCGVASANIVFTYYNDFKLKTETETISNYSDGVARTVTYTYDADGRRATLQYPSGQKFKYDYTGRGQLGNIYDQSVAGSPVQATYVHDLSGNRTQRRLNGKTTFSDPNFTNYAYDASNRLTSAQHYLNTANISWSHVFTYDYDTVGNRLYEKRDWLNQGDGFEYGLASQITGYQMEGTVNTTSGTVSGPRNDDTLTFDASGNRTKVADLANGVTTTSNYTINNLNQYTKVGALNATYDGNGNLTSYDEWTYTYTALNQLKSAVKGTTSAYFWYDGLGRICTRQINGGTGVRFQVWAGWDLVEDYKLDHTLDSRYLQGEGTDEMVSITVGGQKYYLYQDGRGNTSEVADANAMAVETYKYDLNGKPTIYDPSGNEVTSGVSAIGNRFLFTGREYYRELGLYNYRNRFYSPAWGRFLQPDPIGFAGDPANLYRYVGNNPANVTDSYGLISDAEAFIPSSGQVRGVGWAFMGLGVVGGQYAYQLFQVGAVIPAAEVAGFSIASFLFGVTLKDVVSPIFPKDPILPREFRPPPPTPSDDAASREPDTNLLVNPFDNSEPSLTLQPGDRVATDPTIEWGGSPFAPVPPGQVIMEDPSTTDDDESHG